MTKTEFKCTDCGDDDACYVQTLVAGWESRYPKFCLWNGKPSHWMIRDDIAGFRAYSRDPLKEPS